jgi:hypothetical protein
MYGAGKEAPVIRLVTLGLKLAGRGKGGYP